MPTLTTYTMTPTIRTVTGSTGSRPYVFSATGQRAGLKWMGGSGMGKQAPRDAMQMAGLCDRLNRIEAKLDWLIEALSGDEEGDEAPPTVEVRSLDGSVTRLPVGDDGGFL